MLYYLIIIFILFFVILIMLRNNFTKEFYNNINEEYNYLVPDRIFNISSYKNIIKNNNEKKIYKISLSENIKLDTEDCFEKCDRKNCIKLNNRIDSLKKCLKCNLQDNKCFNRSIIEGNCDNCDGVKYEDKINCFDIHNYGCANPDNINSNNGVKPYYIEIDNKSVNSPYNKKCVFCWDLLDNI